MNYTLYDFLGSIGVGTIIITYILLQVGKIKSESLLYSLLNAGGASLIIISLLFNFNRSLWV